MIILTKILVQFFGINQCGTKMPTNCNVWQSTSRAFGCSTYDVKILLKITPKILVQKFLGVKFGKKRVLLWNIMALQLFNRNIGLEEGGGNKRLYCGNIGLYCGIIGALSRKIALFCVENNDLFGV